MFDNLREAWRIIRGGDTRPVEAVVSLSVDVIHSPHGHWQAFYPAARCVDQRARYYADGRTAEDAVARLRRVLVQAIANDYARTYPQKAMQCAAPPRTP